MPARINITSQPAMLEPETPPFDDSGERDDERFDFMFANGDHLRRLRGQSFDHRAPCACTTPPWRA